MKAVQLVKNGESKEAFKIVEVDTPKINKNQILIKVAAFGINYADIMARKGLYNDAPPLPSILGYDIAGVVAEVGSDVKIFKVGDRVVSLTRFGGYAEYACVEADAAAIISESIDFKSAPALVTQYITAYYCAILQANIQPDDEVLIHACAGGVGTAITQLAKWRGCKVWGTAGSDKKLEYPKAMRVDYPINYNTQEYETYIQPQKGKDKKADIFNPIGGKYFKKDKNILSWGGRLVLYGVSEWSSTKGGFLDKIKLALNFGWLHPLGLLMKSQSIIGVNILRIGDVRPKTLNYCLNEVIRLTDEGVLKPHVGAVFNAEDIAEAHDFVAERKSVGKVVLEWR